MRKSGLPQVMRQAGFVSYGFSQLRALEFFVFRKMEMLET